MPRVIPSWADGSRSVSLFYGAGVSRQHRVCADHCMGPWEDRSALGWTGHGFLPAAHPHGSLPSHGGGDVPPHILWLCLRMFPPHGDGCGRAGDVQDSDVMSFPPALVPPGDCPFISQVFSNLSGSVVTDDVLVIDYGQCVPGKATFPFFLDLPMSQTLCRASRGSNGGEGSGL